MTWSNRDEDWKNANSLFQRRFRCLRRPRILRSLMTPAGEGEGALRLGEGNSKMEQRGPSSKHTPCVLAVRLPWRYISPIVSRNRLLKRLQARTFASVWNARAVKPMILPLATWKKKRFMRKKKKRPFALIESYFFLHYYWVSENEQFYIRSPRGGTWWIYHIPLSR